MEAQTLDSLEPEICFLIGEEFYFGPDRYPEIAEHTLVETLIAPEIPREFPSVVRACEALGHEKELAEYYWRVLAAAQRHGKSYRQIASYFWIRLWLNHAGERVCVSFPWYDTLSEIRHFSDAISSQALGELFWDTDQSWEVRVTGTEDRLLISERDPDDDVERLLVSIPRGAFVQRMQTALQEATDVVAGLTRQLGVDVWTSPVRQEPDFRRASV